MVSIVIELHLRKPFLRQFLYQLELYIVGGAHSKSFTIRVQYMQYNISFQNTFNHLELQCVRVSKAMLKRDHMSNV